MGVLLCCGVFALTQPPASAQTPPDTSDVEQEVERLLDDADPEDGDPTQLVERLSFLAEHPLDVNTATADDLSEIPALGPILARRIVAFRMAFGLFGSIPEIRGVEGITAEVFLRARPYLTIGARLDVTPPPPRRYPAPPSWHDISRGLRFEWIQRVTRRLDLGRGFDRDSTGPSYLGSPERIYTRLHLRYRRNVSLNLTMEKDPGEPFEWDPAAGRYAYDHVSIHLALHDFGRLKDLVIGDFEAGFGQGLVLWRSFAPGKGPDPVRPPVRYAPGIRAYGSTEENRFFRGLAATFRLAPALAFTGFASRRTLDALGALDVQGEDTTRGPGEVPAPAIRGFRTSGLHRTPAERALQDALDETVLGGALTLTRGASELGVVGYRSRFGAPVVPDAAPYRRFTFTGQRATMIGIHGRTSLGGVSLFGEAARAPGGSTGAIGGLSLSHAGLPEVLLLARSYPRDFVSLHGYAFGERNGVTSNETGFYLGLTFTPRPRWRVAAYADQYRFPWLRFGVPRPGTGHDVLVLIAYQPRPWLSFYLQARTETRETGTTFRDGGGHLIDALSEETRQSLRLHGDYQFSRTLRFRARLETVRFKRLAASPENGVLLYQDLRWRPSSAIQFDLRFAMFDTQSFDARVFAYENDLLYTFSVPFFSGQGQRFYLLVKLSPSPHLDLQIKYASTRFEGVEVVGSGLDETPGNRIRTLGAQILWKP